MSALEPLDGDVVELDGRGLCAIPGPRRLPHAPGLRAATASTSSRFVRAARATRSCTRPAAASSRRSARRGRPERKGSRRPSRGTAAGCCAPARRPSRGSPATGSTGRPSSRRCARSASAGGIPTWLGAHAIPPEHDDADGYLDFLLADVLPEAARLAEAADVFLERGAFDAAQARRYLEACREHGLALRLHGDQFTEAGAIPLAIELGARSVDHLEATGPDGVAALAASDVTGVLLPASALFLDRDAARAHYAFRGEDGLRARPRHRAHSLRAICAAGAPDLARRARVPPEHDDADAYLDFALAEVLPDGGAARRGGRRLPRARRLRRRRRPGATSRPAATTVSRSAPRRPVHRGGRDPARDRARRALGRPPRGDGAGRRRRARRERRHRRAAPRERALPRPADAAGARARRRRRGRRARDRLQSGQRLLREPAARLLARRDAAPPEPGRGARRLHRQRRPCPRPRRPARADRDRATPPT